MFHYKKRYVENEFFFCEIIFTRPKIKILAIFFSKEIGSKRMFLLQFSAASLVFPIGDLHFWCHAPNPSFKPKTSWSSFAHTLSNWRWRTQHKIIINTFSLFFRSLCLFVPKLWWPFNELERELKKVSRLKVEMKCRWKKQGWIIKMQEKFQGNL